MKEERITKSFESYSQWAGDIGDEVLTKNGFVLAVTRLLAEQKQEIVEFHDAPTQTMLDETIEKLTQANEQLEQAKSLLE